MGNPDFPAIPVLVPTLVGPLSQIGTLAQEKMVYQMVGWEFTQDQVPSGPPNPITSYILDPGQDVHGDFEADDLWQNLVMYRRTGNIRYRQMAELWANYYINHYENDLVSGNNPDSAFGYDHLFGFGLIDWFEETWDLRALAAAIRLGMLARDSYPVWKGRHPRHDARILLLATRLWEKTGEVRWRNLMDQVRGIVMDNSQLSASLTQWDSELGIYLTWDGVSESHPPKLADILQNAWLAWALTRYYEATGGTDTAVKARLIAMAQFAKQHALGPTGQSGSYIDFLSGSPVYQTDDGTPVLHEYTTYWIDILARGYLLSGDGTMMDRALLHWKNGTNSAPAHVGRFVNVEWLAGSSFYRFNGELSYTHTFFAHAPTYFSTPPPPPPPPPGAYTLSDNEWQMVPLGTSQRYVPRQRHPATVLEDRPDPVSREYSGIHYGNGKLFYFGGGHDGYPGNDVETFDIAQRIWIQSYNPEVCDPNDASCKMVYDGGWASGVTPQGRPYTEHTLNKLAWNPTTQKLVATLGAGTFEYNPGNSQWTIIASKLLGPDITNNNFIGYDPTLDTMLATLTGDSPTGQLPGVYKLVGNQWVKIANVPSYRASYATYLQNIQKHLVLFTFDLTWWLFDAATATWSQATAPTETIDSFDYDSKNHVVVGIQHQITGVKLFKYDPLINAWSALVNPPNPPTQPAGGPHAANPIFRYDPVNNVFIFLRMEGGSGGSGGLTQTWAYRYKN